MRKLKSLWARDAGGTVRKIFSGAIVWTSEFTVGGEGTPLKARPSGDSAVYLEGSSSSHLSIRGTNIFTFSDPVVFLAGSTIDVFGSAKANKETAYYRLSINDGMVIDFRINNDGHSFYTDSETYTFAANTTVSTIGAELSTKGGGYDGYEPAFFIRITASPSGIGTFILAESGSYEP